MYDRSAEQSLWPQMMLGARCGPLDRRRLAQHPAVEIRWDRWRELHPETLVVSGLTGWGRDYRLYPYGDYESVGNGETLFPQPEHDNRRPPKERVLAIPNRDGGGIAFPFGKLNEGEALRAVHETADGQPVVVFWDRAGQAAVALRPSAGGRPLTFELRGGQLVDRETASIWSFEGEAVSGPLSGSRLEPVAEAYVAFWFAWSAFVPGTRLWLG